MQKLRWQYYAVFPFVLLVCNAVSAQSFTVQQAVSYGLEHHPSIVANAEQIAAAEARVAETKAARLPQVGIAIAGKYSNNPLDAFSDKLHMGNIEQQDFNPDELNDPAASGLLSGELSVRVPVYDGGRVSAQVRGATSAEHAALLQAQRGREFIAYSIEQAYISVVSSARSIVIAERGLAAAKDHALTTAKLVRDGRIIQSDQLTAELNLGAMESMLAQAINRQRQALVQLKGAMGFPQGKQLDLVPESVMFASDQKLDVTHLTESALAVRKDLKMLKAHQLFQRAQVDVARSGRKPRFDVIATGNSYQDGIQSDYAAWRVMATVSMPLFDGGMVQHQAEAAQRMTNAVRASVQVLELEIRSEIQSVYENIQEAGRRLEIAKGSVDKARKNVALVKKRYGQGRTILIDLLQAERVLVEARTEESNATYYLQKSFSALRFVSGQSSRDENNRPVMDK